MPTTSLALVRWKICGGRVKFRASEPAAPHHERGVRLQVLRHASVDVVYPVGMS